MIKFYDQVLSIVTEVGKTDSRGGFEVTPGTFQVIKDYIENLSEIEKFTLVENKDNKVFSISLDDGTDVDLTLEEQEDLKNILDIIDNDGIEDIDETLESMLTEDEYEKFQEWALTFKKNYGNHIEEMPS